MDIFKVKFTTRFFCRAFFFVIPRRLGYSWILFLQWVIDLIRVPIESGISSFNIYNKIVRNISLNKFYGFIVVRFRRLPLHKIHWSGHGKYFSTWMLFQANKIQLWNLILLKMEIHLQWRQHQFKHHQHYHRLKNDWITTTTQITEISKRDSF